VSCFAIFAVGKGIAKGGVRHMQDALCIDQADREGDIAQYGCAKGALLL
jgi:hypothetical protein